MNDRYQLNKNLAQMLKGGVIMDVVNVEEAKIAKENGADYLGIGAMFSTQTKNDAKEVSFETLRQITEKVNLPFVLIGGITLDNVDKLKQFNPDGYALVSGILAADDIGKRVGDWLNKI